MMVHIFFAGNGSGIPTASTRNPNPANKDSVHSDEPYLAQILTAKEKDIYKLHEPPKSDELLVFFTPDEVGETVHVPVPVDGNAQAQLMSGRKDEHQMEQEAVEEEKSRFERQDTKIVHRPQLNVKDEESMDIASNGLKKRKAAASLGKKPGNLQRFLDFSILDPSS